MATSSRRPYAITKSAAPRVYPCDTLLLTHTSTGDAQTQYCLVSVGSLGTGGHDVCLSTLNIRVPDELWMEVHDIVQETGIKTNLKRK